MVVTFAEDGYWTDEYWTEGKCLNPDDAHWVKTGWRVRAYDGQVLIKSKERGPCIDWLLVNGFEVCPDGEHWQKEGKVGNE